MERAEAEREAEAKREETARAAQAAKEGEEERRREEDEEERRREELEESERLAADEDDLVREEEELALQREARVELEARTLMHYQRLASRCGDLSSKALAACEAASRAVSGQGRGELSLTDAGALLGAGGAEVSDALNELARRGWLETSLDAELGVCFRITARGTLALIQLVGTP